jgi:SAM-dependent methyltransferase
MNTTAIARDELVRCIACHSGQISVIWDVLDMTAGSDRRFTYKKCASCGTIMLGRLLSNAELSELYPPNFYSYRAAPRSHPVAERIAKMLYDRHRFKPHFKRLLEIGGGRGDFIASMNAQSRAVVLERSQAVKAAAEELGVNAVIGDVCDPQTFAEGSFDYVYLSHAFEHLDDPDAALQSIRRWSAPNARLFISIPTSGGAVARYFGKDWYHLAAPIHVALYTRRGIRNILSRHGFAVERIVCNSDPLSIPLSAFVKSGGRVDKITARQFRAVRIQSMLAAPLTKLLDAAGAGDCIEVHAVKT